MEGSSSSKGNSNLPVSKTGNPEYDEKLLRPYVYIADIPSENIIQKIMSTINKPWLKIPEEVMQKIEEIAVLVQNSTILWDDMFNECALRGGAIPSAHAIYGIPQTTVAANYVVHIALEKVQDLQKPEAVAVYVEEMLQIHRGLGMTKYRQVSNECPSEQEYEQTAIKKTGSLYSLIFKLMQLFSKNKQDFTKVAEQIGLIFQIVEDDRNLISENDYIKTDQAGKVAEIRYCLPIIHALNNADRSKNYIADLLKQRAQTMEVKKYCLKLLQEKGSFEYTKQKLTTVQNQLRHEISNLGGNVNLEEMISTYLRDFV